MIDKKFAADIMEPILKCDRELVQIVRDAQEGMNPALADRIKHRAAVVLGELVLHIMNPIGQEYPDLYPARLRPPPRAFQKRPAKAPPRARRKSQSASKKS